MFLRKLVVAVTPHPQFPQLDLEISVQCGAEHFLVRDRVDLEHFHSVFDIALDRAVRTLKATIERHQREAPATPVV